jgi:hypothetical protein
MDTEYVRVSAEAEGRTLAVIVPKTEMERALMKLWELAPKCMVWSCEEWPGPSHRSES